MGDHQQGQDVVQLVALLVSLQGLPQGAEDVDRGLPVGFLELPFEAIIMHFPIECAGKLGIDGLDLF